MSKKIEEITDKIEANKEVLSTMPKNNIKNMDIYQKKLEELEEEFKKYQKDISNRLQRRYQNATKKALNKEIENLETRLKTISYILELLDEEKTSYEKMGLDRAIFTLYVKNYMRTFFQELEKGDINSDKSKEKFEEIYWKCPDIIVHIELNIRNIYLKKQILIDKFFEKEKIKN